MRFGGNITIGVAIGLVELLAPTLVSAALDGSSPVSFNLQVDRPGTLDFYGSQSAGLFAEEVSNSLQGALALDFVPRQEGLFPAGFLNASPPPQGWTHTMWSRDGGTFMRELVFWGYYQHACQVAECLMNFVGTNDAGFIAFPRYFTPAHPRESGTEMDGHAAIIIAMVSLWQRLPPDDPFRPRLYDFLHGPSSPVRYIDYLLKHGPLIPGSGEFGGGGPKGLYDNVVQNNLCALALLSAAEMEVAAGDNGDAGRWRKDAQSIFLHLEQYLVDKDGAWIWCIDPKTLKPDQAVLQMPSNVGFGGLNGVGCMSADVLGFDPTAWNQEIVAHSEKTFDQLYNVPDRKLQFEACGIWTQFDRIHDGMLTSPSYGQGYAIQTMLLFDKIGMAGYALHFLAQATFEAPGVSFDHGRLSPYYFYERLYSPYAKGVIELTSGCGPLNLVNVSEPLKAARLILGVDDTSLADVRIIPRLPPAWTGYQAENWPIRTRSGVVRADLSIEIHDGKCRFHLRVKAGRNIPALAVRLPEADGTVWKHQSGVKEINIETNVKVPESVADWKYQD